MGHAGDGLAGLVALAGHQQHVARLQHGDPRRDRLRTVADLVSWWLARLARAGAGRALPEEILPGEEAAMRRLSDELGGIDVLVSNAALIINKPFEEFSIEEYEDQLRVNAAATFVAG